MTSCPTAPPLPPERRHRPSRLGAAAVLLAVGVLAACGSGSSPKPGASASYRGDYLDQPVVLPATSGPFSSTSGTSSTLASLQTGKLMLVYFGYTHCPDVCPTTMADVGQALRESAPAVQAATQVVFVTSDPARDTVPVLAQWLGNFDSGLPHKFVGLTGTVAAVDAAAKDVGVPLEPPVRQKDGSITVDHGAQLLAFQEGKAHVLWLSGTTVADFKHDFAQLVSTAPASPAAAVTSTGASADVGPLRISGAYVPAPASPDVAAAYFTVRNTGDAADALVRVTSPAAASVDLHRTTGGASGVESMTAMSELAVPAHGTAALTVGHQHLMLMAPTRRLVAGDTVPLVLTFLRAGTVTVDAPVTPLAGSG